MAGNIEKLATLIDKEVFDICAKKIADGGSQGPAAIDERLICRAQRLSQILENVR